MTKNTAAEGNEYIFYGLYLTTEDQFKVVSYNASIQDGNMTWYPDGMGNNYGENGEITADGSYTVCFRPDYDGGDDWFYNCIYAAADEEDNPTEGPTGEPEEPTEAPTDEPTDEPENPTEAPTEKPTFEPVEGLLLGDVDGDGEVSILDATAIQRYLAELPNDAFYGAAADTDGDGDITILDATYIQLWLASLPSNENIGQPIA